MDYIHKNFNEHKPIEITYMGISNWYKNTFKKAGWMILGLNDGYTDKIKSYKQEIEHLIMAIENKKLIIEEKDRKNDLDIMKKNLIILHKHFRI
jgi:hypothetical protein